MTSPSCSQVILSRTLHGRTWHKECDGRHTAQGHLQNFVLIVDLKFKSKGDVQRYGEIFTPETLYVKANESGHNFAYKLLQSENSPLHLTIFERYAPSFTLSAF